MWKQVMAVILAAGLTGCGESREKAVDSATTSSAQMAGNSVKALPFSIEDVMLSDMFKDNIKVARINVRVDGGSSDEWIATAMTVAEKGADLGADSIEATVDRSDIDDMGAAPMYHHLAKIYFSPNPKHTVWEGEKQMQVMVSKNVATREQIQIDQEFEALNKKYLDRGMDMDTADKKAGAVIAKKFHLKKDWRLFSGGLEEHQFNGSSFNVDSTLAKDSLSILDQCMRGRTIRMFTRC